MGRIAPVCKGGVLDSTEGWGHLFADDEDGCGTFSVPVKNLWNSADAAGFPGDIGQRVYTSRLIGGDPSLVLHGGGNTSVKVLERNLFGEEEAVLYVKGSGCDLASIGPEGFSPCRMAHLLRLAGLDSLSDTRMVAELRGCMTNPSAPMPSVEAILHALLPARFVDHTHADALISVMNTAGGEDRVREIYGDTIVIVPYVMPGFRLARLCATEFARKLSPRTVGVALMSHGLITFGETAESSYSRMIECVGLAEKYLSGHKAWAVEWPATGAPSRPLRAELAAFRRELSGAMGAPAILTLRADARSLGFARRPDVSLISQRGPATPDHVVRTKRLPMIGRDVAAFSCDYEGYFSALSARAEPRPAMLDPAPRIVLDPEWGLVAAGRSARDAAIAGEIYGRTIDIIMRAEALGGWRALPEGDLFDVEYWDLEQAKLRRGGADPAFGGEVALVTGAASGIGRACVDAFLRRGAAVVGLDMSPGILRLDERPDFRGIVCDLTDEAGVAEALEEAVRAFGGLDMLVLNAGIFPPGKEIGELGSETWRKVMSVNLDASFVMMRECHPLLKVSPRGGRVAVIGSKNVPAPGPGAAAYSASKAAVNQLARVAALEWGADRIRVNSLHPNMVFDTALWTKEVLESRARHYGLSVEAYKANNVLKVEIASRDVAELAAELCGPLFAKTTGAQIPVDGGNERVI
jgi:rhamnose utilization protein RhaD (predicted bifunctional aldolase and dehydrogenase)/NAD(P)-dependent dehydrogenase (short-subunit alcohol dehydrogenase family)